MILVELKKYLQERKLVPLQDIAFHFDMDIEAIRPMIDQWIRKGKVRKQDGNLGCAKGCCKCDPATIETYEWLG